MLIQRLHAPLGSYASTDETLPFTDLEGRDPFSLLAGCTRIDRIRVLAVALRANADWHEMIQVKARFGNTIVRDEGNIRIESELVANQSR